MKRLLTLIFLIVFSSVSALRAQTTNVSVTGRVDDPSKAAIAGVKVTLTNEETNLQFVGKTNDTGSYYVSDIPPGTYRMVIEKTGFRTLIKPGIVLHVQDALQIDFEMALGSVTETITVGGGAPTVQLTTSSISSVVTSTTVRELPLNGRSWTDLATLQPGVSLIENQPPVTSSDRTGRGLGSQLSISGGRPQQNNYLLDGVNIDDYANTGGASLLGGNLGTDAIGEFVVVTSNFSTQYGRASGGVISAVTKSGTNQFHGDVYEFLRNSALDARNFFDGPTIPSFRRNQFGAAAGGPIQKDKTFVFADFEGIRQSLGTTVIDTVPSPEARAGNLTGGAVTVDPQAARFLSAFYPLPNGPISGDAGIYSFVGRQPTAENYFIARGDHTFSDNDRLSISYMYDNTQQTSPDEFENLLITSFSKRHLVALEENHVFSPQWLNSFRVGFNRDYVASPASAKTVNPATRDPSYNFGTAFGTAPSAGEIDIDGFTSLSVGGIYGLSTPLSAWNSWQAYDNVFYDRGVHSIKFGANIERIEYNEEPVPNTAGDWSFNSLPDFLTNQPASFVVDLPGQNYHRGVRQTIFGAYFQDDVHLRPNLTLNLGLRYEMASVVTEVKNLIANLRVLNSLPPKPFLGSPLIQNPSKLNFEPRVGFAWSPFSNGKTAVRGAIGVFDILPMFIQGSNAIDSTAPYENEYSTIAGLPAGTFPTGGFPFTANTGRYYVLQFNPSRNYVGQWNFNIQHELKPNLTAMVGYVGARGVHMYDQTDDNNMVLPTQTPQGLFWPCPSFTPTLTPQGTTIQLCNQPGTGTIINSFMGRTQMGLWNGDYYYDGLQAQITKIMSHGFQIQGSYTWAKNIDLGSGSAASDQYLGSISTLLYFCPRCRRGLSDTDIRHDLTLNYLWQIPTPLSFATPLKAVLGGWEIGGIFTAKSGSPFTVTIPGDPLGMNTTDPWQYPDRIKGPGCTSAVNPGNPNQYVKIQCFTPPNPSTRLGYEGRNSLIGPGLMDFDFSLYKNTRIKENLNAQFRAEFFNVLNRANFRNPTDNLAILNPDGTPVPFGGSLTGTTTTSRQIQFALKLSW